VAARAPALEVGRKPEQESGCPSGEERHQGPSPASHVTDRGQRTAKSDQETRVVKSATDDPAPSLTTEPRSVSATHSSGNWRTPLAQSKGIAADSPQSRSLEPL